MSFQMRTWAGASTASICRCSASIPGARSTTSWTFSCGRISAMRGNSRCVMKPPFSSTTIQARSRSSPVSVSSASPRSTPAQDLMG